MEDLAKFLRILIGGKWEQPQNREGRVSRGDWLERSVGFRNRCYDRMESAHTNINHIKKNKIRMNWRRRSSSSDRFYHSYTETPKSQKR